MDVKALEAVARPFREASPLPRAAFVDPAVFALEQRAIFAGAWMPVASCADVQRPGDWVRADLPGEDLVIVRDAELAVSALRATCSHRGTLLLDGDAGHLPTLEIQCPYHRWTYATDGRLLAAPGARAPAASLARLRVRELEGVILVNRDDRAPALDAPKWLAGLTIARVHRTAHEVHANWKVLVGNFQESHHFPSVHPGLESRTPWTRSTSLIERSTWLGGSMELADDAETVSESRRIQGRPFVAPQDHRRQVLDALIFPLLLTSLQPDYFLTYRLVPLAVDRTGVVAEIHMHPAVRGAVDDVVTFWERTNAEDRAICERQQRGLTAGGRPGAYCASEDGLHAFERMVAQRYLEAR